VLKPEFLIDTGHVAGYKTKRKGEKRRGELAREHENG